MVEAVDIAGESSARGASSTGMVSMLLGLIALAGSAIALAVAPAALGDSYSWIENTTSESGGQGVAGAWVARTGFLLFGLSVIWVAKLRWPRWRQPATAIHLVFAVCMFAVAAYSSRPWLLDAGFDATEDLLHSVAATVMGFAFAFGVAAVAFQLRRSGVAWRLLDGVAVVASVVLPLGMSAFGKADGVLQRVMFGIAYLWYGRELLSSRWSGGTAIPSEQ